MLRLVSIVACFVCVQGLMYSENVNIWDFPYQAAILRRHWDTTVFHYSCSGAIISDKFILTTAYCAGDFFGNIKVRVGSSFHHMGGLVHDVQDIYKHFNFTPDFDFDIALVKLSDNLKLSHRVSIVKLPPQNEVLSNAINYKLCAWGYTSPENDAESKNNLRCSNALIRNFDECKNIYDIYSRRKILVTDNMICVNDDQNYNSNPGCEQDQGAPMVTNGIVYGLFSWNYKCGSTKYPAVLTKVSNFRMWIDYILELD